MRKLGIAGLIGSLFLSSTLYAACVGPFCWDDVQAYVNGFVVRGEGVQIPGKTKAAITTSTAPYTNLLVVCTDCATANVICVSTSTNSPGAGSDFNLSTGTQCK